jgi:hypothetical protein
MGSSSVLWELLTGHSGESDKIVYDKKLMIIDDQ